MGRMSLLFFASILAAIGVGFYFWMRDRYEGAKCPHPNAAAHEGLRWLQLEQKKNHPPTILLEVRTTCRLCGRETHVSWFTEEQCKNYGIETPSPIT